MTQHTTFNNHTIDKLKRWFEDDIDKECHSHCTVDCNTNHFSTIVLHKWLYNQTYKYGLEMTRDYFMLQMSSNHPITSVQYTSKFDLVSYLIYVGGIIGMWIGIDFLYIGSGLISSILSMYKWTRRTIAKIKSKITANYK